MSAVLLTNSIPAIALPVISRGDMLKRCLESIDYPVENLIVFVNSDDPSITKTLSEIKNDNILRLIIQTRYQYGRGCGPAFNETIKAFPKGPYWMLVGADNFFQKGTLQRIDEHCRAHPEQYYFWASDVVPIVTVAGVSRVGLFDENIYPCYFEDCDYLYRLKLSGMQPIGIPDIAIGHGSEAIRGNATTHTNLDHKFKNEVTYSQNREYYISKWGGEPNQETFASPFNIPNCPVSYWSFQPELRSSRLWEDMDELFGPQRRQFILSYMGFLVGELGGHEDRFLASGSSTEEHDLWRLGVVSLARQVAAVPADCMEELWNVMVKPVAQRYLTNPQLIERGLSNFDTISISDLELLLGSDFDLQARIGLIFLTGDRGYLDIAGLPSWFSL